MRNVYTYPIHKQPVLLKPQVHVDSPAVRVHLENPLCRSFHAAADHHGDPQHGQRPLGTGTKAILRQQLRNLPLGQRDVASAAGGTGRRSVALVVHDLQPLAVSGVAQLRLSRTARCITVNIFCADIPWGLAALTGAGNINDDRAHVYASSLSRSKNLAARIAMSCIKRTEVWKTLEGEAAAAFSCSTSRRNAACNSSRRGQGTLSGHTAGRQQTQSDG